MYWQGNADGTEPNARRRRSTTRPPTAAQRGGRVGADPGFDENAFRSQYVAQLASRAAGAGALHTALQTLGECYGSDAATLLGSRPSLLDELVRTASTDHALNAGPAPAGMAMGDAGGLAMLDFYLADPQIRTLIDTYGGPTPPTNALALEQQRLLGSTRFDQLMRLHNALGHVRYLYTQALTQAQASGQGPGWGRPRAHRDRRRHRRR